MSPFQTCNLTGKEKLGKKNPKYLQKWQEKTE